MPRKLASFGAGQPGASHNPSNAKNAFISASQKYYWTQSSELPATIWYDFRRPIRVVKIGFSNSIEQFAPWMVNRSPKTIKLMGSHDCPNRNRNWVPLVEIENAGFEVEGQFRSWEIPEPQPYSCYGIRIQSTNSENASYMGLKNILMWENMHDY